MKKVFFKIIFAAVMCLTAVTFTNCKKEGFGDFSISVKEVGADYVDIFVTAPNSMEMAYVITESQALVTPAVLFATGNIVTVSPAEVLRITDDIFENKKYIIYAVAKLDAQNYSSVVSAEFTTKKYSFEDVINVVETYPDGYKVHIKVPQSVKDAGNVLRYGGSSISWYNMLKNTKGETVTNLEAVMFNGNPWGRFVKNDSTLIYNNDNILDLDENGEPQYGVDGVELSTHDPIAPGEPTVYMVGEFKWGSEDEIAEATNHGGYTGGAYMIPMFDYSSLEWTGTFEKHVFKAAEPEEFDAQFEISIPEDEITVTDAMVYFTPGENVTRYFYMILDDQTYNQIIEIYFDGNEEYYQWFLTSYHAMYEWGIFPETEATYTNAASKFYEPLNGGSTYHVLATVMGDDAGMKQKFYHTSFTAKEKTKPAPVIEVTAVPSDDPYSASFNIKAPNKDVSGAYWAANYARDWELMFNQGYTYQTLLKGNFSFTSDQLLEVNSDAGCTMTFSTLDGETTRMAVYGCNDEYTFNIISDNDMSAVADYTSPYAPRKTPVESSLYEELAGEWTATATIVAKEELEDGSIVSYNINHSSKVVISRAAPELPEELPAYVYDLYSSSSKDDVDAMFEELQLLTDQFTEHRIVNQNRLLCGGFIDFDYYNDPGRLDWRTPFELFTATNYNSLDIPMIIYDFGPKWFLEVLEDGSVIVPFHSEKIPPMLNWPGYPFYVGGYGEGGAFYDATDVHPGFPVVISEDRNKITIKPITLVSEDGSTSTDYYMNALGAGSSYGEVEIVAPLISELVLTRGWNGAANSASVSASPVRAQAITMDGAPAELPKTKTYKSLTPLKAPRKYVEDTTPNVVTMEMFEETNKKILEEYFNIK